ncbi:MAG: hypothetical protein HRT47_05030 [Candidatus Caenarcaniphilales bacterium]|nr:hypothetical protein [Candidatus Caenarcaniphilales bacterium]
MVFLNVYNGTDSFISPSGKAPQTFLVNKFNPFIEDLESRNSLNKLVGGEETFNIENISNSTISINEESNKQKLALKNELLVIFSGLLNSIVKNDMDLISDENIFANFTEVHEKLSKLGINNEKLSPNSPLEDKLEVLLVNIPSFFYSVMSNISNQIKSDRLNDLIQPTVKETINYLLSSELEKQTNNGEKKLEFKKVNSLINNVKQAYKSSIESNYFGDIDLYFERTKENSEISYIQFKDEDYYALMENLY